MFDKYIVCEDEIRNVSEAGQVVGFQFQARLPYYRGLGISMIEDLQVEVDGQPVAREAIRVTLHGRTYTLDEMEREYDDRWEFGEKGMVTVRQPGGLGQGQHRIQVSPYLRISYLPFILTGQDAKTLTVAG